MKSIHLTSKSLSLTRKALAVLGLIATLSAPVIQAQPQGDQQRSSRLITHPETVKTLPSQNKRWALLIGVDRYEDSNIGALKGAANDANSLKDVLVNYAGFPQDQIVVLSTSEPFERQPTRKNILKRLSNLSGLVPKDGLLLIAFAGHGIERNGHAFLIPADAILTEDLSLLGETAIAVSNVKQRIKDMGVQQVMILLDACRAYPTGRSNSPNPLSEDFAKSFRFEIRNQEVTAFAVLYATAVGYRAYEYSEKHQGYFSWAIAQALKGAAANERGEVTLQGLVKYLEETVPKLVALDYGSKVIQKPFADIEGYRADELVLSVSSANAKTNESGLPSAEAILWSSVKDSQNPESYKDYLVKYPNGMYSELAKSRIRPTEPLNPKKRGTKSEKLLYSYGILKDNHSDRVMSELFGISHEFNLPLITSLEKARLTVIRRDQLSERDSKQVAGFSHAISRGEKSQMRSLPAAVYFDVSISLNDLPSYNSMYISVSQISVRVVDMEEGRVITVERIGQTKGFGNTQDQARRNSLREAANSIPQAFIDKVSQIAW